MAAAISGSACSSEAVKNESGAEAVLAKVILRISPPPQPFGGLRAGLVWRSEAASAIYHIARNRPSSCGSDLRFMQDMVGLEDLDDGAVSGRPCPERPALGLKGRAGASQPLKPGIPRLHGIHAAVELPQIGEAANRQPVGVFLAGFHQRIEIVGDLFPRLRARRRRAVGEQIVGMHDPVNGSFHGTLWFLPRLGVEIRQPLWPRTAPRT